MLELSLVLSLSLTLTLSLSLVLSEALSLMLCVVLSLYSVRSLSDKEPASTNELESAADSLIAAITISAPWIELTPPMAIPAAVIPFKILSTFFLFHIVSPYSHESGYLDYLFPNPLSSGHNYSFPLLHYKYKLLGVSKIV